MTDEKLTFDPYHVWLGIPPKDQPPNHYRLLGLELFEDNTDVIDAAANRQSSYLHSIAAGPHRRESQKLLNEVAAARLCLLDTAAKADYDQQLKSKGKGNPPPLIVVSSESEKSYKRVQAPKTKPADTMTKSQPLGRIALIVVIAGIVIYTLARQFTSPTSTDNETQPTQPAFSFED